MVMYTTIYYNMYFVQYHELPPCGHVWHKKIVVNSEYVSRVTCAMMLYTYILNICI